MCDYFCQRAKRYDPRMEIITNDTNTTRTGTKVKEMEWILWPRERIEERNTRLNAYKAIELPQGSLETLCTSSGDWKCTLEIDYFHARIEMKSLPAILGRISTTIGGSKITPKRNFPVVCKLDGIAKKCPHLDVISLSHFRVQVYFSTTEEVATAKALMTTIIEKKHKCHFFKPNPDQAKLCEGQVMIPIRVLMESLKFVLAIYPLSQIFLHQYGQRYLWGHFRKDFADVIVPDRHNLWDLTLTMRHKEGHIIMFRRNGNAGIFVLLLPNPQSMLHTTIYNIRQYYVPRSNGNPFESTFVLLHAWQKWDRYA